MKKMEIITTGFVPNSQIEFSMANLTVSPGDGIAEYLPLSIGSKDMFDLLRFRRGIKNTGDEKLDIVPDKFWQFVIRTQDGIEVKRFSQDAAGLAVSLDAGATSDIEPTQIENGQFIRLDDMLYGYYSLGIMANANLVKNDATQPFATAQVLFEYAQNGVSVVTAFPPVPQVSDILAMGMRVQALEQEVDDLVKGKINPN